MLILGTNNAEGLQTIDLFYSPDYGAARHAFPTTRKADWIAASLVEDPVAGVEIRAPASASAEQLTAVHEPAYIAALRTGQPRHLAESQGFEWDPGLWRSVSASMGGVLAAAQEAQVTGGVAGSLSSGLHHASRGRGKGFCSVNGLALAAFAARSRGADDVLILDLDAHCGGGTHQLIAADTGIAQLDIATNGFDAYEPERPGDSLVVVDDAADYLSTVTRLLDSPRYCRRFDLVLYNAGMDPLDDGVPEAVLAERERLVFRWAASHASPVAFVIAGGYSSRQQLVALHRLTIQAAAGSRPE